MGLTEQQLVWAMGIGATQGGGFRATHASMCSGFIPANAGRNGLLAARLAASDFTCNDAALETSNGFLEVFGAPPDAHALTRELGEHWECMNVAAKPFPAGCFIHPTIDACLQLVRSHSFLAQDVEQVDLQVHKLALGLTGKPEPRHAYDAQVSVYHWAAAVLVRRGAGLPESSDACVNDPDVIRVRQRVVATVSDELGPDEAFAAVTLRDGRRLEARVSPCLGSAGKPMSDGELNAKFMAQAAPLVGEATAEALASRCWNIAAEADVAQALSQGYPTGSP
jgi:2-methylcitrate dehydratase PrpD